MASPMTARNSSSRMTKTAAKICGECGGESRAIVRIRSIWWREEKLDAPPFYAPY
jgi:hypothetical protein